jgi:hypothetical protein
VNTKLQWSHERTQQQTLQNRRRTTNIFGFSIFEARTEENSKQSKIFLDFSNIKPKIASKAKLETKKANKEKKTEIFLVFLCFGKKK